MRKVEIKYDSTSEDITLWEWWDIYINSLLLCRCFTQADAEQIIEILGKIYKIKIDWM